MIRLLNVVILFLCFSNANAAIEGTKKISLIDNEGKALVIADIIFESSGNKTTYQINLVEDVFQNEFLSMRPFKCIHQPKQMLCHLIYPYQKQGHISQDNLIDLEYDLLFLHKSPEEYGINAWNGLYYKLTANDTGYSGQLMEVDLNVLAAPPEDGVLRPVTEDMLYEADPAVHMFPKLVIE